MSAWTEGDMLHLAHEIGGCEAWAILYHSGCGLGCELLKSDLKPDSVLMMCGATGCRQAFNIEVVRDAIRSAS